MSNCMQTNERNGSGKTESVAHNAPTTSQCQWRPNISVSKKGGIVCTARGELPWPQSQYEAYNLLPIASILFVCTRRYTEQTTDFHSWHSRFEIRNYHHLFEHNLPWNSSDSWVESGRIKCFKMDPTDFLPSPYIFTSPYHLMLYKLTRWNSLVSNNKVPKLYNVFLKVIKKSRGSIKYKVSYDLTEVQGKPEQNTMTGDIISVTSHL